MDKMKKTTVCVMDTTVESLNKLKLHPRQSHEEVIKELIKCFYLSNVDEQVNLKR